MKRLKINATQGRIIVAIVLNIVMISLIAVTSGLLYRNVLDTEEEKCWGILEDSAESLEKEIDMQVQANLNILQLVAGAMVREERTGESPENLNAIVSHLNDFRDMTIFMRIDVLMKNGKILLQSGEVRESTMDFQAIAEKGVSMSGRRVDVETGKNVVRCSVPVVKDGQTVAILLGVVDCAELPKEFSSRMYDGEAYVCLVDRTSGDFIMDEWHGSLGNIYEMQERKKLPKYEHIDLHDEVSQGKTGVVAYLSNVNGKASYMFYKPIENLNWQMIVVAQEDAVFSSIKVLKTSLGYLLAMVGVLLIAYLSWSVITLSRAMKKESVLLKHSYIDSLTEIYNYNKFSQIMEEYEQRNCNGIGLVFLDLNGLKYTNDHFGHEAGDRMLKLAARILTKYFGQEVYRIGGDEFVALAANLTEPEFAAMGAGAKADMNANKIETAMGAVWHPDSKSMKAQLKEADDLMYQDKRSYHE